MSTLFISHSSRDAEVAAELADWLQRHGHHSLFLDFDVEHGIPAGRDWEKELYRRLRACQALIVLCSDTSMASCWCLAEISHARALGKPILPIRIAPCTLRPQLRELQVIDLVKEPEAGYERLRRALAGVFDWDPRRPPYPGLMAFEEQDAAIFFGRDADIQRALDRLNRLRRFGGPRLLLFLGASGSGKSSLMRAGILPRLRATSDAWTLIGPMRPGERPREALVAGLLAGLEAQGVATGELAAMAGREEAPPALLPAALEALQACPGRERSALVLVIDQLEEALKDSGQASAFRHLLRPVLQASDGDVLVIATLRSDFLGALQAQSSWRDVPLAPVTVAPLSVEGFSAVIEGPAQLAGLDLEAGLAQKMVADTATEDALPLLAFTLRELWERGRADGRLTLAEYRELGGLHGAVAQAAEAVLAAARPTPAQRHALRRALFALVRLDDEGRYTRRVVRWQALPAESQPLLERFVQARLLIAGDHEGERTLEVAHESLFRVWRRLNHWLRASREALRVHEGLRRAAADWEAGGKSDELLVHRGGRLEEAEALAQEATLPLDAQERRYLEACRALRDAEREERRRRERIKRRWVRATWLTLLGGVIGLSGFAWSLHQQAQATRQGLADLHWANAVSARDRDDDPLRAGLHFMRVAALALEPARAASAYWAGERLGGGPTLEAVVEAGPALAMASFASSGETLRLWSREGGSLAWSEGGEGATPALPPGPGLLQTVDPTGRAWRQRVAVQLPDGRVRVHDRLDGELLIETPPALERLWIGGAEEATAVTRHAGGEAWVWDLRQGERRGSLAGAPPAGVAFAPLGTRLLTWTGEGAAFLHEAGIPTPVAGTGPGQAHRVVGGALGRRAGELALWDAAGTLWLPGQDGHELPPSGQGRCSPRALGARFLDAPARLLVWNHGACGTARLWALETLAPLGPGMRHPEEIAPPRVRGERLFTWTPGAGPARLWDAATGELLAALPGPVSGARFAAPPGPLITWHGRQARLWSRRDGTPLGLPLRHAAPVVGVDSREAGRRLLSWSADGGLRLWRGAAVAGVEGAPWRFPAALLDAVPLPGEARVLAVTLEGRLWSWAPTGERPVQWLDRDAVYAAFSPDGGRLLTATADGEVRVWNREDGGFLELAAPGGTTGDTPLAGVAWGVAGDRLLFWGEQGCTAWLWRLGTARVLPVAHAEAAEGDCRLRGARFAEDGGGRALTWGEDRRLRLWDTEAATPALLATPLEGTLVRDARLAAEGEPLLVASAEGRIRLLGEASQALAHADVRGARWHAGTRRVLSWSAEGVRLWDADRQALLASLSHHGAVAGAAFMPDGERLISWQTDGGVRLWDALGGQPLTPLLGGGGRESPTVDIDASTPAVRVLVATGDRGRLWRLPPFVAPPSRPVRRLETLTGSRLTPQGEVVALPAAAWRPLTAD
ncbi:nSTAND1 domain-containing NTPase [Halomonas maura]|uniref:nSTAND1 domain-containing NTPase n=1 Tax=Halomonas maura TaxID=117606 RepID=UPI0025B3E43C|nr:TIR domain-containing protein [Halomonas maura]MDN3557403.1 TIR domain-containing protein [Halomonas maura]